MYSWYIKDVGDGFGVGPTKVKVKEVCTYVDKVSSSRSEKEGMLCTYFLGIQGTVMRVKEYNHAGLQN